MSPGRRPFERRGPGPARNPGSRLGRRGHIAPWPRRPSNDLDQFGYGPLCVAFATCSFQYMTTREQAEQDLRDWATNNTRRDDLVRAARLAGVSKSRIHELSGIARTTINRIVAKEPTVATMTYQAETTATGTNAKGERAEVTLTCTCKRHRTPEATAKCLRQQREDITGYAIKATSVTAVALASDGTRVSF